MGQEIFIIDAFSKDKFSGNPAGVCVLDTWLDDETMQNIAMENNQAETAFLVMRKDESFDLRWFTPQVEVDLCGHATLAASHALYTEYSYERKKIVFHTRSGVLTVHKVENNVYEMDFPGDTFKHISHLPDTEECFSVPILEIYEGTDDYIFVTDSQINVETAVPNFDIISLIGKRGVLLTSKGEDHDFVSRCFFPNVGINEDSVTGSAHTLLTPFWVNRIGKQKLLAKQLSKRGGEIICTLSGDRILLRGSASTYLKGEIYI